MYFLRHDPNTSARGKSGSEEQVMTLQNRPIRKIEEPHPEPLARFVRSVDAARKEIDDEVVLANAVAGVLARLVGEPGWLRPEHRRGWADRYRQHVLHVAPDGGFSVVALVWRPGQKTPIHDHVSWCVVGVYEGEEEEIRYRLHEGADGRFLVPTGWRRARPGQTAALIPPEEDIHEVANVGSGTAISIHVYGADIGKLGSSINHTFDHHPVLSDPGEAPRVRWRR
jgi:3-mercaptopropionate dioxygenase